MRDRGGESWTLGDLGGGGGRVQSLLCLSSWESQRERERENANTKTKVRNGGACLSRVKAPTWPVCGNRQKHNNNINNRVLYTRAKQNYHFSVRIGPTLYPDFPILELWGVVVPPAQVSGRRRRRRAAVFLF